MSVILVRVTTFNPEGNTAGRINWRRQVVEAIIVANGVFGRCGIIIRTSDFRQVGVPQSGRRLTQDIRHALPDNVSPQARRQMFNVYRALARAGGEEFALRAADVVPLQIGQGIVNAEARSILQMNRARGQVATYWVPRIIAPVSSGQTVCEPMYSNIPTSLEGIFIKNDAPPATLAHELGHLLMRCMHCEAPVQHQSRTVCNCASRDNLMHGRADTRRNTNLNGEQVRHLRNTATMSGYLRG